MLSHQQLLLAINFNLQLIMHIINWLLWRRRKVCFIWAVYWRRQSIQGRIAQCLLCGKEEITLFWGWLKHRQVSTRDHSHFLLQLNSILFSVSMDSSTEQLIFKKTRFGMMKARMSGEYYKLDTELWVLGNATIVRWRRNEWGKNEAAYARILLQMERICVLLKVGLYFLVFKNDVKLD